MAIGAKSTHILTQFLCEAVMLCGLGGVLGILLGWFLADFTTESFMGDIAQGLEVRYVITYWMIVIAIGVSTSIGIFFGFYPAWRASRLDPINALRYE
jgi:putative ABC transport system permease protein